MPTEIKYINHGICSRSGNIIYVNKRLKDYPTLYYKLLEHENKHSYHFNWNDLLIDLNNLEIAPVKNHYYKFMLKNPSSWTVFLPVWYIDRDFLFDINMTIIWALVVTIIVLMVVFL